MSHKSIPYLTVIDVNDLETGLKFWASALGATYEYSENDESVFKRLKVNSTGQYFLLQKVPELKTSVKNRVHLDIATDDIQRETERLIRLGAQVVERQKTLTIMADPFRNEFCVVMPENKQILDTANIWE